MLELALLLLVSIVAASFISVDVKEAQRTCGFLSAVAAVAGNVIGGFFNKSAADKNKDAAVTTAAADIAVAREQTKQVELQINAAKESEQKQLEFLENVASKELELKEQEQQIVNQGVSFQRDIAISNANQAQVNAQQTQELIKLAPYAAMAFGAYYLFKR